MRAALEPPPLACPGQGPDPHRLARQPAPAASWPEQRGVGVSAAVPAAPCPWRRLRLARPGPGCRGGIS